MLKTPRNWSWICILVAVVWLYREGHADSGRLLMQMWLAET